jgi:hypothetical protein
VNDQEVNDTTLAGAEETARKILKRMHAAERKPFDVTVLGIRERVKGQDFYSSSNYTDGDEAIDFTLRGFTERTRELLVTTTDGKKEKLDKHPFGERVVRRLTAAEHAEYSKLQENLALAKRALEAFQAPLVINWREHFEVGMVRK